MSALHACAAKQVVSSSWGAPLLGSPKPDESHPKDAPRQIPSKFRTSPTARIGFNIQSRVRLANQARRYEYDPRDECSYAAIQQDFTKDMGHDSLLSRVHLDQKVTAKC